MGGTPAKALREKTSQELQDQLMLEKKRLFDGIVKASTGEAIKPHDKREGKKVIARIEAILRERELRKALDARIAKLEPLARDAGPEARRLAQKVEKRLEVVKADLARAQGERKGRPMPRRVRGRELDLTKAADRAAVRLAEARRRRLALDRVDVGETK
jgi:ribosomal protein L29